MYMSSVLKARTMLRKQWQACLSCAPVAADRLFQRTEESTQNPIVDWKQIEGKERLSEQCCARDGTVSSARLPVQRYIV